MQGDRVQRSSPAAQVTHITVQHVDHVLCLSSRFVPYSLYLFRFLYVSRFAFMGHDGNKLGKASAKHYFSIIRKVKSHRASPNFRRSVLGFKAYGQSPIDSFELLGARETIHKVSVFL